MTSLKNGDIVICTGLDHLFKKDAQNILESLGVDRNQKLIVLDTFDDGGENILIFDNPSKVYADKFCIDESFFTKLEDIRDNKLIKILK
jgi:hypothetical protein